MKHIHIASVSARISAATIFACGSQVAGQTASGIPQAITTPIKVETRLGVAGG